MFYRGIENKTQDLKILAKMNSELIEAIKESEYPREIINEEFWNKEPLPKPPKEIFENTYYEKVINTVDDTLLFPNQELNDEDMTAVAEALARTKNITVLDLRKIISKIR